MTAQDRMHVLKRKLAIFGATTLAVAAIGAVAIAPGAPREVAAESTASGSDSGPLIRTNLGTITYQYVTPASTYVVIGPGGVMYGPDGSPIPENALATLAAIGFGTPTGSPPVFTISTPTPVASQGQPDTSGSQQPNAAPPQAHYIGALDAPPPVYVPITPTPTSQYIITGQGSPAQVSTGPASTPQVSTGQVSAQPTMDPSNNPNVIIGTPSGGVNSMGIVRANPRG